MTIKNLSKNVVLRNLRTILKIDHSQFKGRETWEKENFLSELPSKFDLSLWAQDSGRLIGFLIASKRENTCHIHRIAVDPSMTGEGIGSKMIAELEKICLKKKIFKIDADTFKKGAIRNFYLKNGFILIPFKEQKKYALKKPVHKRAKFLRDSIVVEKKLKEEKLTKIVAIHQPNFIPWLGYFDKIAKADIFIILDNVQFEKNNVLNRNKIKTANGSIWLTVPVMGHISQKIYETKIDNSRNWRKDHLKTLYFNYKKAKNFDRIYPLIEKIYARKYEKLIDFNSALLKMMIGFFQIKTPLKVASKLNAVGHKNALLINIIKKVTGDIYLAGQGGSKRYLDQKLFREANIKIIWQNFKSPIYPQLWGSFIPNLSAIDFLFSGDIDKVKTKNHKIIFS